MTAHEPRTAVFFDGSCPLCRSEIGLYRRCDRAGALRLVDVAAPDAEIPAGLARAEAMARFHVLADDGRLISGAAAFVELWRQLPGWRWAGRLASLPAATFLLEAAYRLFLVLRPALVRLFVAARAAKAGFRSSAP